MIPRDKKALWLIVVICQDTLTERYETSSEMHVFESRELFPDSFTKST